MLSAHSEIDLVIMAVQNVFKKWLKLSIL